MSNVSQLSRFRTHGNRAQVSRITGDKAWAGRVGAGFTADDLVIFQRLLVVGVRIEVHTDDGGTGQQFAMIYQDLQPWASWAVCRTNWDILVWNCTTSADLGRFETMWEALAFLPGKPSAHPDALSAESARAACRAFAGPSRPSDPASVIPFRRSA